jgi:phosphopantothenoylcysteine decarboxylase/phosphopantothenate--cysteine ligase
VSSLRDKKIVVGVGGGIAAFKAVMLVRELLRRGAKVRVVMTESATRFIGPITFTGIVGEPAITDLWNPAYSGEVHVELADWADAIVVAPATANLMARAAHGFADDVLLATLSCADCPVVFAPAMHDRMWRSKATQRSVELLKQSGVRFAGPVQGELANGRVGMGRMTEPNEIADALTREAFCEKDLRGFTVLVSAGPTLEDLDPVRFIANRSSGRMGYAIAAAARDRGAQVVLVTGPTNIAPPDQVELLAVRSALEMQTAIEQAVPRVDAVVMTAAVADYRAATPKTSKIKKQGDSMSIELVKNPDILAELGKRRVGKHPVLIGFAMETDDVVAYGRKKLVEKKVDMVVANEAAVGFGRDDTQVTFVMPKSDETLPPLSKSETAHALWDRVKPLLERTRRTPRVTRSRRAPRPAAPRPARRSKGRSRSKG